MVEEVDPPNSSPPLPARKPGPRQTRGNTLQCRALLHTCTISRGPIACFALPFIPLARISQTDGHSKSHCAAECKYNGSPSCLYPFHAFLPSVPCPGQKLADSSAEPHVLGPASSGHHFPSPHTRNANQIHYDKTNHHIGRTLPFHPPRFPLSLRPLPLSLACHEI